MQEGADVRAGTNPLDPAPERDRRMTGRAPSASEFDARPELKAAVDAAPVGVAIDGLRPRGQRRVAEDLLLVDRGRIEQILTLDRQFEPRRRRDAERRVEEADRFLKHRQADAAVERSEEHTSELQSLMRISYAFFCLKK